MSRTTSSYPNSPVLTSKPKLFKTFSSKLKVFEKIVVRSLEVRHSGLSSASHLVTT